LKELTVNKTYVTKESDIKRDWWVVDADGQNLGRLAAKVAAVLRGKHKTIFTPSLDTGDFVVIVNAEKVAVTGNKLEEKKYYSVSLYPGGLRVKSLQAQLAQFPDRVLRTAVWGMLPHNKLGRAMLKKLKVYAGPTHPHAAQKPSALK
jgi:large subunit ribosomal protein L13